MRSKQLPTLFVLQKGRQGVTGTVHKCVCGGGRRGAFVVRQGLTPGWDFRDREAVFI